MRLLDMPNIKATVAQLWSQNVLDIPDDVAGNSDVEWLWFSGLIERTLSSGATASGATSNTGLRGKGSAPIVLLVSDG